MAVTWGGLSLLCATITCGARSAACLARRPLSAAPAAVGDRRVGRGRVGGAEDRGAGDEQSRARSAHGPAVVAVDAAVDLDRDVAPAAARAGAPSLSSDASMNGWPPQPGFTVMQSATSSSSATSASASSGVAGLIAAPAAQPASRIACERVVQVRRRLGVDGDRVGAGARELGDLALGPLDHQVHVEHAAGRVDLLGERGDDQRPDRDRRDEVAVHHVDVDHARARLHDRRRPARPGARSRPRGSTARRGARAAARQLGSHAACGVRSGRQTCVSIDAPQWLQLTIAVLDMRTIVECSPQLGQTDDSSKRRRQ